MVSSRDVLRRHQKTCKAQRGTGIRRQGPSTNIGSLSGEQELRKGASSISNADQTSFLALQSNMGDGRQSPPNTDPMAIDKPQGHSPHSKSPQHELPSNEESFDLLSMPPIDLSELDFLFIPVFTSDIAAAERLDYMVYFTSTAGMASFTDEESFKRKQKMAFEAHEISLLQQKAHDEKFRSKIQNDPLASKSHELLAAIRDILCAKKNEEITKLRWTKSVHEMVAGFFSPPNIRRFLMAFWSLWYPNCPIVHRPLFQPSSSYAPLLCVMVVLGACLSPEEEDRTTAKSLLGVLEELVFSQKYFYMDGAVSGSNPIERKERLQCLQASYLACSLLKREGSADAQARVKLYRYSSMIAVR